MITNKEKYRALCEHEGSIPIFCRAWWLDAVAEKKWDVVIIERGEQIVAALPFVIKKKYGFKILTQPKLTQHLGPWIKPSLLNCANYLGVEKELLQELFLKLPKYDMYRQNWSFERKNWLPLYWLGFKQTTRYTYRIEDLTDQNTLYKNFQSTARNNINKALNRYGLEVKYDVAVEDFLALNKKVFDRQNMNVPYSAELVKNIEAAAVKRNARQILLAIDKSGNKHSAVFLIYDKNNAYLLISGSDPEFRKSAALSLLTFKAMNVVSSRSFDFEGSMIEGVETSIRTYGATQTPYFAVSKINSKILKLYEFLRDLRK